MVSQNLKSTSASQVLETAEYLVTVSYSAQEVSSSQWRNWLDQIKASSEIWVQHKTKKGKIKNVNLRERLFELEFIETASQELASSSTAVLRYVGACRNDGTLLRPEQIPFMLEFVTTKEFELLHIHRSKLILAV